ncbi:MAG: flavin reductase family protein [Clostridia bacterium]|nr:flavin reductase family protein [Clostridia bacterium]
MKKSLKPTAALAPNPVALVSAGSLEKSNITTIAWTGIINSDPMLVYVSIRKTRLAHEMITEIGNFVINLPTDKQVVEADLCGTKSGRDIDKYKECNFTKSISSMITSPGIKECPINIECKVKEVKNLGSHDMFIAEVVNINIEEELLDSNDNILFEKANLISFAGKKYFANNKEVGYRGVCLK